MRVRIIFRGLVLFSFEKPRGAGAGGHVRDLRAWLVGHAPEPSGHPAGHPQTLDRKHVHKPYIGVIARDAQTGREFVRTGITLPAGETRFELTGHPRTVPGVSPTAGFLGYVPRLADLVVEPRVAANQTLAGFSSIAVPHGTISARDLVSWHSDGNPPVEVAFMGTNHRGFVANEAVLDVGDDDSDFEVDDPKKFLSVESSSLELPKQLWPLAKDRKYQDETDPNTVEILITNFSPQRRRSVFWSLHYQFLFRAAGFPAVDYTSTEQYRRFEAQAKLYDPTEWGDDLAAVNVSHPFPFILTDSIEERTPKGVSADVTAAVITKPPPNPPGRERDKGISYPVGSPANDPWARPICPMGLL